MFEYSKNAAMDFIMGFSHSGKPVKDLSRIKRLLCAAGNPQDRLKFVHIAGTNGKGSSAQMFSEIFLAADYKTGLFTSPYIVEYSDRIKINGKNIPDDRLSAAAQQVSELLENFPDREDYSQFEITLAIAFLYFAEEKCDIVVLETGLGGLLDCTNIVSSTILTVICSVDFDHTAILGDSLEEIARQKAGIIKRGVPCVLSAGNPLEAVRVVSETAVQNQSQLVIPNISLMRLKRCDCFGCEFEYRGENYTLNMGGAHQVLNAMSVIEGIRLISADFAIPQEKIAKGLERAVLCGRVQILSRSPLTILDGAHNPDGLAALAGVISHCEKKPCTAIIGMCRDKNIAEAVSRLIGLTQSFVTVDGFCERCESKQNLADIINSLGGSARPAASDIMSEISAMQAKNPDGLNLICGSLFLAAKVINCMK